LFLLAVFLVAIGLAFRPGARAHHEAASLIPLRDED
jgi:cbb3-type cytochrome oxidase subunit 3